MPVSPGESFGRYKIISQIGVGGMGEVFLAEDTSLERKVAIKILGEDADSDSERLARFSQEAKAASALNHPNILTIFDIAVEEGLDYIVSEYVEGETLRKMLKAGRLPLDKAVDIAIQTASALSAAHAAGIVHRDIKPANIMIRGDGIVKVLDFGVAKLLGTGPGGSEAQTLGRIGTEPGVMIGTPRYMSPEQARGKPVDQRSDIFSLGLVLYELFSGNRPFEGENSVELVSAILKDEPEPIASIIPDFPPELERIVTKSLRKDRKQRYQDIRDLQIDLEDYKADHRASSRATKSPDATEKTLIHVTEADTTSATGRLTQGLVKTRRFTLLHAILFTAAVAVVAAGVWWFFPGGKPAALAGEFRISSVASWSSAPGEISSTAKFSPDGKMIVFSSTRSGKENIWVTQTGSTEALQITKDEHYNTDPVWSPAGDEVAYISRRGGEPGASGPSYSVWKVSALGGTPKGVGRLMDGSSRLRRWGGSGKIYFDLRGELAFIDPADGSTKPFWKPGKEDGNVLWSVVAPDEKKIAFVSKKDDRWEIREKDDPEAASTLVVSHKSEIGEMVWLPEESLFYYSLSDNGTFQVFGTAGGSGEPVRITNSEASSFVSDASTVGDRVIFSSAREESNIWKVDVASGTEAAVVQDVKSDLWPSVSPDGSGVAFQSVSNLDRGSNLTSGAIMVKSLAPEAKNTESSQIAEEGFLPRWSPAGGLVAFIRALDDKFELRIVDPAGGTTRTVASGINSVGYSVSPYNRVQTSDIAWSPDGNFIAFIASGSPAKLGISGVAKDSTAEWVAETPDEVLYCPVWSSDGRRLAFYAQSKKVSKDGPERELRVYDLDSKETRSVFSSTALFRLIGWTPDETGLVFAESPKFTSLPPETKLRKVSISDGNVSEIGAPENAYFYNIFLSSDRQKIAYAARNGDLDDVWLIPAAGGKPEKLTKNNDSGLYFSSLAWAPDGKTIFFGKQTRFSLLSMATNEKEKGE